ncbi:MAG: hypothetical protein OER56_14020 [Hyphomicrobiales bacterium]|nr:hypothetical protein [Hyphomicrobiales bacterium]
MSIEHPDTSDTFVWPAAPISRTMIELPSAQADDAAVRDILQRGNIPLLIGDSILAEVANNEINEGLSATGSLSSAELADISTGLVESISDAFESGGEACNMAEVAADAAALFVLCLRRNNVLDVDNIPACSVSFTSQGNQAQLIVSG